MPSRLTTFFSSIERQFIIKLMVSLVMWYIIGNERASKGKNAGIWTFSLVISWSMLFTFLSEQVDPASTSRIAAQIVTGIWFLWAWIIMQDGKNVRNLTTAAWIRFAWAVGMAIGFWFYIIATVAAIIASLLPKTSDLFEKDPQEKKE